MITRLAFAAPYVYSPRGLSQIAVRSRDLRDGIKAGDTKLLKLVAQRVALLVADGCFPDFFGDEVTLVPVPGRAPQIPGGLWVPEMIANELCEVGLAREVWPVLKRDHAVPKSAWARPGERPGIDQHLASMSLTDFIPPTGRLLLVDDFVTKGRTLLAAAIKIHEGVRDAEVRAFACVRTMGLVPDIEQLRDPVVGAIHLIGGDASRAP